MEPSTVSSINKTDSKRRLLEACNVGDLKYLGEFIVGGGQLKEIFDEKMQNSLHYCVKRADQSQDPDPVCLDPFDTYDRLKCARVIIKANPEFMTTPDSEGFTPLHLAILQGDLDFLKLLHEFNCDFKTPVANNQVSEVVKMSGRNCIHLAVINDKISVLRYLLTINAKEYINNTDDQGATPLHYAVQLEPNESEKIIDVLIDEGDASLDGVDSHGRTPLIWASTVGSKNAVKTLLKKGANLSMKDAYGLTALHCAASRGQLEIIQTIMSWLSVANADDLDKMSGLRDIADADGCSPLFYSVTMGHPRVTSCLLKYGSNVMLSDSKGRTLCHCLARINIENLEKKSKVINSQLKELLNHGMDPWKLNMNGATALHEACLLRNYSLVEELTKLDKFQDYVNLPESLGHTPLHLVVAASWSTDPMGLKLCKCLLQNGANVNAITKLPSGKYVTSLDLAKMNEVKTQTGVGELQRLLHSYGAKTYDELMAETKVKEQVVPDPSTSLTGEDTIPEDSNIVTEDSVGDGKKDPMISTGDTGIQVKPKYFESGMVTKPPKKSAKVYENKSSQKMVMRKSNCCQTDRMRNCSEKGIQLEQTSCQNNQTNTSSVASTPDHSAISSHADLRGNRKSESSLDVHNQRTRSNAKTKNRSTNKDQNNLNKPPVSYKTKLPFSQTYLERELPKLLKQYLEKENESYSLLTGRHRMPKPTISPYLLPVVPGLRSSDYSNMMRNQRSGDARRPMKSHNPSKGVDSDASVSSMPPLKKTSVQSQNSHASRQRSGYSQSLDRSMSKQRTATASRIRQSVADYEFYRFVDQLLKYDHMHKSNGPSNRIPLESPPKQKPKPNKHRTAMGGEISPPGRSDDLSDSDEYGHRDLSKNRPKSSKVKYYQT